MRCCKCIGNRSAGPDRFSNTGQALIASTVLGPGLGKDQYLKIICADPNHVPGAAKPSAEHIAVHQP